MPGRSTAVSDSLPGDASAGTKNQALLTKLDLLPHSPYEVALRLTCGRAVHLLIARR